MRQLLLLSILVLSMTASARSYDERVAEAMNSSDWFALDSIYGDAPKDSIMPFLEVYARGLIGNRLNRPDVSIPAFRELLDSHSDMLDTGNRLASSMMLAMDLSRTGENRQAAQLLSAILSSAQTHLDSAWTTALRNSIDLYSALSEFRPYGISFGNQPYGKIPFGIRSVGPKDKGSVLMHLENSSINGIAADITFDTGAGVNIISDSLARRYNLVPLGASAVVAGVGLQTGYHAIAKELKIGNITITDVPFSVMNITSGNEEADKFMDRFMIVIGSEVMLQLKDLTVDFVSKEITVPKVASARTLTPPDMCFSSGMNLLAKGRLHDNPMLMCIDTGDASYGSLNCEFFDNNKEYVTTHGLPDTIRNAGIGGVHISPCYRVSGMTLDLGGCTADIPEMIVSLSDNPSNIWDYECNLGLRSLMRFGKVRFNMVDFTLTAYPPQTSMVVETPTHGVPAVNLTKDKKPTFMQSAGLVVLSVANGLLNANAPTVPDL